ncbi:MAG: hypothetical protein WEC59_07320 [Salibacteraceae bacterium]
MIAFRQILFFILLTGVFVRASAQESESDLNEKALALFEQEEYESASKAYSTLLSINTQSAEYNYRFGASQLFTIDDKEEALKYLKFATTVENPPALAYFYYGLGLHLNYQFDKAVNQYKKYQPLAGRKEKEADLVEHYIAQCEHGKKLVSSFTDISVIQRSVLPRSDFFRDYDLTEFGGKIIVKPSDFMSEEDKKRDSKFLMYFQQDADLIYYASYSEKNETGKDLYVIQKLPGGKWSEPLRLDETINTNHDEDFPFIHPEGSTLYFASKGHNSMGGYDIFKSDRRGDGMWSKPMNMEFAINTPWDDFMFITDLEEKTAWFASNRETNNKQVTVYHIGIQRVPLDLTLIKGTFEAEGSKMAKITVEDMIQDKVIGVYQADRQLGNYLLDIKGSGQYKFLVEAEESNAVHSGIVEIPRDKGLKQFRQEMKLVNIDGKEQLQIINHFDDPIEDEQLLTADILKKQASLAVNSTVEEVDADDKSKQSSQEDNAESNQLSKSEKSELAAKAREELAEDAKLFNQKAAALYEVVQNKYNAEDPDYVAEASLAAELASKYKSEAERRQIAVEQIDELMEEMKSSSSDDADFNAKYTQIAATQNNFTAVEKFEDKIKNDLDLSSDPTISEYESKSNEVNQLENDIKSIDEEIVYYNKEIENTDDDLIKEELKNQIKEANNTKNVKQIALERARKELVSLTKQKELITKYLGISKSLLKQAAISAPQMTNIVSSAALNEMQLALDKKTANNPALIAMINPEKAAAMRKESLKESRKNSESDIDTSVDETALAKEVDNGDQKSNQALNEEIERIGAEESKAEKIEGDFENYFEKEITSAKSESDPIIAESKLAELYDQWSGNIQLRIDSLNEAKTQTDNTNEQNAIDNAIDKLNEDKAAKEKQAMDSYQRIAKLTEAEAAGGEISDIDSRSDQLETGKDGIPDNDKVPPIDPAILESDDLPPTVGQINDQFEDELTALDSRTAIAPNEAAFEKARSYEAWADALKEELDVLKAQMDQTKSIEIKNILEQKAVRIGELRMDKISQANALRQEANKSLDQKQTAKAQADLQDQILPYVENYNQQAFEQIDKQIRSIPDDAQRSAQIETLYKNWLIALQNEKVKTEARIANDVTSTQKEELTQRVNAINSKGNSVNQVLDSLKASKDVDGPSAPATVYVKGSERFEGYVPVKVENVNIYQAQSEEITSEIEDLNDEITTLESALESTTKKKEKAELRDKIASKKVEEKTLNMRSAHYSEAAEKLASVETQLLTISPGEALPSEKQAEEAEALATSAQQATTSAQQSMADALSIKKKKEREPAIQSAEQLQAEASIERQKADLAKELTGEMEAVEEKTIEQNFIILPTYEVVLPRVNKKLNPNEQTDVAATKEFRVYNRQLSKADSIRKMANSLQNEEQKLLNEGQSMMEQSATAPNQPADENGKMQLIERAYANFEKADSLSKLSAQLKRQSTFTENKANRDLLALPEEAYMNILAYYNNSVGAKDESIVQTEEQESLLAEENNQTRQADINNDETSNNINETPETNTPQAEDEQPFNLNPPKEEDEQPVTIKEDEVTNTIFEIDDRPSAGNYNERNPIPVDPPLPSGLMYKVQIGAFRNPIKPDIFKGIAPIIGESTSAGFTRYAAGEFNTFSTADNAKQRIQGLGFNDAFVVAYLNGKRISVSEARKMESGESIAAEVPTSNRPAPNAPLKLIKQGPIEVSSIENTRGTFYTVQVGVFSKPVSSKDIANITPLQQENLPNGTYRYSTGKFNNVPQATEARNEARSLGINDAFVTAYRDGKRITVAEAGSSIGSEAPTNQPTSPPVNQPTEDKPTKVTPTASSYTVLLGVFSDRVPLSVASKILTMSSEVQRVENPDGTKSYFYGSFDSKQEAENEASKLRSEGLTEAKAVSE